MKKIFVILALIILPQTVIAAEPAANTNQVSGVEPTDNTKDTVKTTSGQEAGESLNGGSNDIDIPTNPTNSEAKSTETSTTIDIVIKSTNKTTGRLLGGVTVSLQETGATAAKKVALPDPPTSPEGESAFKISAGKYKLIATRTGYKELSEERELTQSSKLTLELEPLSTTLNPDTEYSNRLQLLRYAQSVNQTNYNYPYNQNYATSQYVGNTNFTGYQTTQNGYVYSNNQNQIVPLVVNIPSSSLVNTYGNYDVRIIDIATGNEVSLASYNNGNYTSSYNSSWSGLYTNIARYACLRPNQAYVLRFRNPSNYTSTSYQDYTFTSAAYGGFTKIDIIEQQINGYTGLNSTIAQPQIQNYALQAGAVPINCPYSGTNYTTSSTGNGTTYNNGTTTWGDQTVNISLLGNYKVEKNESYNKYFLVNTTVYNDARPITFVENNAGDGGLAFVPAQSGNFYSTNYSSNQWYMTTYTRNISAQVSTCKSYVSSLISKTEFTKLDATVQAKTKTDLDSISSSSLSNKEKLTLCLSTKTTLADAYQKASVSIAAMDSTEVEVTVNIAKFTRVNLTPQEYQKVVAGKVLENFDVK